MRRQEYGEGQGPFQADGLGVAAGKRDRWDLEDTWDGSRRRL